MRKSNYDKRPAITVNGQAIAGWENMIEAVKDSLSVTATITIDCYTGVYYNELKKVFENLPHDTFIDTATLLKPEPAIRQMTERLLTDDVLFGFMTHLTLSDYFDEEKLAATRKTIDDAKGKTIVFGYGAALVGKGDVLIYADMPRWEIQQRMRRNEVNGLGVRDNHEPVSIQYKRGIFNDWKILDRHKQTLYSEVDFWLDTTDMQQPKMIDRQTFLAGMEKAATTPFRVVPFFDPAPWGGQWMKEVCDLDRSKINYGWCFDCVPEENSLLLRMGAIEFEMPAINLVYFKSTLLLGEQVESRFGKEFPIRFDFLDTMEGGNLSLQVHPTVHFAKDNFGLTYTQDESYYLLDAADDATVYLGLKENIDKNEMLDELEQAQQGNGFMFDADKYVNTFPAKKHDHFLIPAGTIHCSGKNAMVLEISATPFIYTFKLWDWNRMGLDGKPRPVNIARGRQVINWQRDTTYAKQQLVNKFETIAMGDGWVEEKTGLHKNQFIETRRHKFTKPVLHQTNGSVNVLNLVEGDEIIVESTDGSFEPFTVHYAETFIIPASVGEYVIKPSVCGLVREDTNQGSIKEYKTIKAFVKLGI